MHLSIESRYAVWLTFRYHSFIKKAYVMAKHGMIPKITMNLLLQCHLFHGDVVAKMAFPFFSSLSLTLRFQLNFSANRASCGYFCLLQNINF